MLIKGLCDKCGGDMGPPIRSDLLAFQEKGRVVRECVKCGRGCIHMTSSEQAVMQDALFASALEQKT
jgi:hypothetical protein